MLQLSEWPGNWLQDILLSPSVCLSTSGFFLTQFFWPNLSGECTLPSELAKACFCPGYTVVGLFVSSSVSMDVKGSEVN